MPYIPTVVCKVCGHLFHEKTLKRVGFDVWSEMVGEIICPKCKEFEEFWNRNAEILLKFCDLYKIDKVEFKKNIYDQWRKYGLINEYEPKLEKLYRQAKAMIYLRK